RGVDALSQAHKGDTQRLEFFQQRDQVLQVPAEAIQAPAADDTESASFGVDDHAIECRPAVFRTTDPAIDIFDCRGPSARVDVAAEFRELILWLLIRRGDTRVNSAPHGNLWAGVPIKWREPARPISPVDGLGALAGCSPLAL